MIEFSSLLKLNKIHIVDSSIKGHTEDFLLYLDFRGVF